MRVILGIDTSTSCLSVAAAGGGDPVAERSSGPGPDGRPRHTSGLLAAVEEVVAEAGGWDSVERIAVGVGPGTFTGLRIGVATARGLAQARGLPLTGVSSLAALAGGAIAENRATLAVLDAKRKEAFWALFDAEEQRLWEPAVGTPVQLVERLAGLAAPPFAVGGGSLRFRAQLEGAGAIVPPESDLRHQVLARHVCRLASGQPAGLPGPVEPDYLRRPDAELWRERDKLESRPGD